MDGLDDVAMDPDAMGVGDVRANHSRPSAAAVDRGNREGVSGGHAAAGSGRRAGAGRAGGGRAPGVEEPTPSPRMLDTLCPLQAGQYDGSTAHDPDGFEPNDEEIEPDDVWVRSSPHSTPPLRAGVEASAADRVVATLGAPGLGRGRERARVS